MKKNTLKLILFLPLVLFITGGACPSNDTTASNKVAQSEIYQSYSITQNGQNYDVTAYFRVGGKTGTTLALSAPSKVAFNNQPMQEHLNTSSGTYYTVSVPNNTPTGTFAFTDRSNRTYTNKIELSKTALAAKNLRINGASSIALPLSRPALETANLNLEVNDQTIFVGSAPSEMNEAYYDRTKNSIVILPAAWKNVPNGNSAINLEVRNAIPTTQGTALGGEIVFTYQTAPLSVAVVKVKVRKSAASARLKRAQTNSAAANNAIANKSSNLDTGGKAEK